MRFFDIRITQPTSLRKNGTNATTLTVAFQAKTGEEGFQIYVAPIIGTKITEERFMMGEPSGVRNDQTETSVVSTRSWGKRTKWGLSKAIFSTKSPHTNSSNLGSKAIYINP